MLSRLTKMGRKQATALTFGFFVLVAGWTMAPDKLGPVTIALAGISATFAGAHAYTDAKASAPAQLPPKAQPQEEGS